MNIKRIKEMLMSKKGMAITGAVVGGMLIAAVGVAVLGSEISGISKKEDNNKVVAISKAEENNKDKVEKERVDKVTDKETTKVSEDSKKDNNETTTDKEKVDTTKDKKDENKEVVSNISSNSTSSNITSNTSQSSNSGNTSQVTKPQVEKPNKPTNTNTHSHSWEEVYNDVHHDEVGHWEKVLISEAWNEEVPVYEEKWIAVCNGCGADISGFHNEHMKEQMLAGNYTCGSWAEKVIEVKVGTNTINHPAKYDKKWVVDKAAWTEKVLAGHKCSCGVTK